MLLEEPESEIGKKIKHILSKGIVNPLRRYIASSMNFFFQSRLYFIFRFGVARFESIMELRKELENLTRKKCDKDMEG